MCRSLVLLELLDICESFDAFLAEVQIAASAFVAPHTLSLAKTCYATVAFAEVLSIFAITSPASISLNSWHDMVVYGNV